LNIIAVCISELIKGIVNVYICAILSLICKCI